LKKVLTHLAAFAKPSEWKMSMKRIYVGNLEFASTADQLRSLFAAHGTVESVTIVTDRDSGQGRGFAFVEMTKDVEGKNAIMALDGTPFGGRKIIVNEARPRPERDSRNDSLKLREHRRHRL
jgi:RNA recognition motif-containing protein